MPWDFLFDSFYHFMVDGVSLTTNDTFFYLKMYQNNFKYVIERTGYNLMDLSELTQKSNI